MKVEDLIHLLKTRCKDKSKEIMFQMLTPHFDANTNQMGFRRHLLDSSSLTLNSISAATERIEGADDVVVMDLPLSVVA